MGSLAQISSGAIRCSFNTRFRARFRRVPEGSGADTCSGSGGFRCRYLVRLWRVRCRYLVRFRRVPSADSRWGSRGFRCRYSVRFRKVRVQMLCEVPEGSDVFFIGIKVYFCIWAEALARSIRCTHILVDLLLQGGGGQGAAWKKSRHKWLDQALCTPKQIFEGMKRQHKDNNLNTRGLADDWQIDGRRKLKSHLEPLGHRGLKTAETWVTATQ